MPNKPQTSLRLPLMTALFAGLLSFACKTPNTNASLKNEALIGGSRPACAVDERSWAGRMGMKVIDGGGGAAIECVVIGEGLHHIGLRQGDKIVALNNGAKVDSAQGFERAANALARGVGKQRIRRWEFSVVRGDQDVAVKPGEDYPGCGIYVFDDCGPLAQ